ncbi:hypothetical protein BLNAU_7207 [Blattamonas nauphoetae]|uniref:Uncharacterized protein n=1 Tax=Blattamonas nauphoetae TaxID=2049346 RepID=A0ABQ9Y249_9EUKA|nr:hypothetical protein BLNAU_7207 [Blattamonas nauphoetae]
MLTTSAPPTSEVFKLKQFVTRLLLHRMHFEVPFTTNLLNHRLTAFTLANHISLAVKNDPLSTVISPEESPLLCEEPLNIRYLYPSMLYSNVFPDAFIIQVAVCAAGWDHFLTLFLTNTHLDFFFLPPFFWSKMGKIQKDCTHALENQTVSFNPDDVESGGASRSPNSTNRPETKLKCSNLNLALRNRNRQSLMHRPISITKNTTDNAEFFRAEVPYKTGSEPEDVSISPSLTHPIAPLPQFTHLLDIATSRIFIGITWDILHVTSHLQNQLKYRGEISVGERVDGSTGGVWSLNHSDRFLFTVAERGATPRQSPSSDSEAVGSDTLLLFTMTDRAREGAEAAQSIGLTESANQKTESERDVEDKKQTQTEGACAGDQGEGAAEATRSLEDEEFEREPKELLKQEKSEKKRQNLDDLVLSEEGLSGADDGDKVLAGLQDTAFRTIAQLLQPSEDDGLKEYLGAMESIADAIFASNLEVEGEEEMTDVAFSFVSEDELSDSDKSDMERLLTMLSPVDSSDSVMLLHQNNRSLECKRNK